MINLYSISNELKNLIEDISEAGGEVTPDQEALLQIKREELSTKVMGYDAVLKMLDAQETLAKQEIERINGFIERKKIIEERLKQNLLQAVLEFGEENNKGVKKLQCGTISLSTRKSTSIEVEDFLIDNKYKNIDLSVKNLTTTQAEALRSVLRSKSINFLENEKISKTRIKEDIEKGIVVEGAKQESKLGLTIK